MILITHKFVCCVLSCRAEREMYYERGMLDAEPPKICLPASWHTIDGGVFCDKHILKIDSDVGFAGINAP